MVKSIAPSDTSSRPRVAVVSPFVDKRHGTERCLAEQIEWLANDYDIHLFSSRVEDVDLSRITWHRVPELPGPHLAKYLFWFLANPYCRWRVQRRSRQPFALVYSPGINCLDADVILVHHIFADHRDRLRNPLRLSAHPFYEWPRLTHRRLFYALISWLEGLIYPRHGTALAAISQAVTTDFMQRFDPRETIATIYHGVDPVAFNPDVRLHERVRARREMQFRDEDFVVLLIGNDWEKKGLACLITSMSTLTDLPVSALIVGSDQREPYLLQARQMGLTNRLRFAEVSSDALKFYAAADVCSAPSIYDPFGLPVLEAMACGLPVIASQAMGASEIVTDGENGLILADPRDAAALSAMIRRLFDNPDMRIQLGNHAADTARNFTWDANAAAVAQMFENVLKAEARLAARERHNQ
jgi:glycosyltransferase involved in cell wall biosynthesis